MLLTTRKSPAVVWMNSKVTNSSHLLTSFNLAHPPYFKPSFLSELKLLCLTIHTHREILFHLRPFPLLLSAHLPVPKYPFFPKRWPTLNTGYSSTFRIIIMIFSHFVNVTFCYNNLLFSRLLQCRLQTTQIPTQACPIQIQ